MGRGVALPAIVVLACLPDLGALAEATLPGFDCDQKPFVWPLMILGE